jgi:hypothetical protein
MKFIFKYYTVLSVLFTLVISCILLLWDYSNYISFIKRHETVTEIKSEFIDKGQNGYYNYFFVTSSYKKIYLMHKMNSKNYFDDYLKTSKVIYNSKDPENYYIYPYFWKRNLIKYAIVGIFIFIVSITIFKRLVLLINVSKAKILDT